MQSRKKHVEEGRPIFADGPEMIIALEIHIAAIDASIEKILDKRARRAAEQVSVKSIKFRFALSASTGPPARRKLLKIEKKSRG